MDVVEIDAGERIGERNQRTDLVDAAQRPATRQSETHGRNRRARGARPVRAPAIRPAHRLATLRPPKEVGLFAVVRGARPVVTWLSGRCAWRGALHASPAWMLAPWRPASRPACS